MLHSVPDDVKTNLLAPKALEALVSQPVWSFLSYGDKVDFIRRLFVSG